MSIQTPSARAIFERALELTSTAERAAYLDQSCAELPDLRDKVEALLAAHAEAGSFLGQPALDAHQTHYFDPISERPGSAIGPYKLLEQIGEGGFGVVFMAEQSAPVSRRVALKVIKPGMDTRQVIARFEAERQALALMDHPNIAKVLEAAATESGRPYFVMELVRGIPITEFCDQNCLSVQERLELFISVCYAVQHAHQKGIIHRDIKPTNVLVTLHDGKPVAKVIDFGVAKATGQRLTDRTLFTAFAQMIGTPLYMSPEQAEMSGLDVDTRSDIYSLGVLLYELLTGTTPFDKARLHEAGYDEIRRIIRQEEPPKPSTRISTLGPAAATTSNQRKSEPDKLRRLLRGDLDWIVMKCLDKDRNRRYETANGLARDIERFLSDEPVQACPPSTGYRLRKLLRRNKGPVAAAALLFLALSAGMIGTTLGLFEARRQRDLAQASAHAESSAKLEVSSYATRERDRALDLQQSLARQYLRRGQSLCEQGDLARGLHWMARGLKEAPANSTALKSVIGVNLAAWAQQWVAPRAILEHEATLNKALALSPDGKRAVTGAYRGLVQFWSVETGESLPVVQRHLSDVTRVAFSPDSRHVVSASADHTAQLWDAWSGMPIGITMKHEDIVADAAFSPDAALVATASSDRTVRLWNSTTGEPIGDPIQHDGPVSHLRFSADGSRLLTAQRQDGIARVWRVPDGTSIGVMIRNPAGFHAVDLSPDGKTVVTGGNDKTARLWNVDSGSPIGPIMRHAGVVRFVVFSPDGRYVLTGSTDGTARLWDAQTAQPTDIVLKHPDAVLAAGFGSDGKWILTGGADKTARLWDADTGQQFGLPLHHDARITVVALAGRTVLTGTNGSVAALWSAEPATLHETRPPQGGRFGGTLAFSPDGDRILLSDDSGHTAMWWFPKTNKLQATKLWQDGFLWSVAISNDGKLAAAGGWSRISTAQIWSLENGERLLFNLPHADQVRAVAISPDAKLVATACFDGTARLWSAVSGQQVGPALSHPTMVEDVGFSPDGKLIVTACGDGAARIWCVESGRQVGPELRHRESVLAAAFSPDGKLVATGSRDNTARFWDVATGRTVLSPLEQPDWVEDVCFSPDGSRLATAGGNGSVRQWSVGTGELLGPPRETGGWAFEIAYSPDGNAIALANWGEDAQGTCLWTLPLPSDSNIDDTELWLQVLTWTEMDDNGVLGRLDRATWQARREQLQQRTSP